MELALLWHRGPRLVSQLPYLHKLKVTFFQGTSLRPPPLGGKTRDARWIDIHEDDLDETQMATWIRQAAAVPGWGKS